MEDKFEQFGQIIDEIDNLAHALEIPLPAEMHVDSMKNILPEKVEKLKQIFVELSGENPW